MRRAERARHGVEAAPVKHLAAPFAETQAERPRRLAEAAPDSQDSPPPSRWRNHSQNRSPTETKKSLLSSRFVQRILVFGITCIHNNIRCTRPFSQCPKVVIRPAGAIYSVIAIKSLPNSLDTGLPARPPPRGPRQPPVFAALREHLPPLREHLPPLREHLPPLREHLPPLREHLPPLRKHLPPLHQHLPPLHQHPPPLRHHSPPLRHHSPHYAIIHPHYAIIHPHYAIIHPHYAIICRTTWP